MKNNSPFQLALFGHPVAHSQSPAIHQSYASQFNLYINYHLVDVQNHELEHHIKNFFNNNGKGANITVPHKFAAAQYLDTLSEAAQQSGSVNTIVKKQDQLVGYNTDGIGLVTDLHHRIQFDITGKTLLIFGAGGAVAGIMPAILEHKPDCIYVCNRTLSKAKALSDKYDHTQALTPHTLNTIIKPCDLIINATTLGHHGKAPEIPKTLVNNTTIAYDLSYGTITKPFGKSAYNSGIQHIHDGIGMLYYQAAYAFKLWFGKSPQIDLPSLNNQ